MEENKAEVNNQPSFGILTQYAKDISFENFFRIDNQPKEGEEPKLDVKVKVDAKKLHDDLNEVTLFLSASASAGSSKIFLIELQYVGIFSLENFPDEMVKPTLFVECPRLLFPFARSIIAQTVAQGNMPMPLLPIIDFAEIYFNNEQKNTEEAK